MKQFCLCARALITPAFKGLPFLVFCIVMPLPSSSQEPDWSAVNNAVELGRPQTAIRLLEPILHEALAARRWATALEAMTWKIQLEAEVQGGHPEEKLLRLEKLMATGAEEMRPLLQTVLAHWYHEYFLTHRWRFLNRTQTSEEPGEDIKTWDLARILSKIDAEYQKALANRDLLKKTSITEFKGFLIEGTLPTSYRPTLFDFIAHEALKFYTAGEQAGAKPEDDFTLTTEMPIFALADEFTKWMINAGDRSSPVVRALELYQELLRFHANDADKSAFLDVDLARLSYGFNTAVGDAKNDKYKAALEQFAGRWAEHPITAVAFHRLANVLHSEGDWLKAHEIAKRGIEKFPDSPGGKSCFNLLQQIEAKEIGFEGERVMAPSKLQIHVNYRNLSRVYFRLVTAKIEERMESDSWRVESLSMDERKKLLAAQPTHAWTAELPATHDFKWLRESVTIDAPVTPGFYYLIASCRPDFAQEDNVINFCPIWVSNLALVHRITGRSNLIDGFLLNANDGEPIAGGSIEVWSSERSKYQRERTLRTDEKGMFQFAGARNLGYLLMGKHGGDSVLSPMPVHVGGGNRKADPTLKTYFFTDRALYRPGQMIQYKGIAIRVLAEDNDYDILPGVKLTVSLRDVNGREVTRKQHTSNEYGSFSGSFIAPRDKLTGPMSLVVVEGPGGVVQFQVEEYKRPKFQVKLGSPTEAAKLNSDVVVRGTASSYTGAAIDGAQVKWRVVREVRFPIWWRTFFTWWLPPTGDAQEIAHGVTTTADDGSFQIVFNARPDPSASKEGEPIFHFTIHADATDNAGETRSDTLHINVGYKALRTSITADAWQEQDRAVKLKLRAETLDGIGQQATGTLKIHKLIEPDRVHRVPFQQHFNHFRIYSSNRGGRGPAPHQDDAQPRPDLSNPNSWELGEIAFESAWQTNSEGNGELDVKLPAGAYRAVLSTKDAFGNDVKALLPLQVLNPSAARFGTKVPHHFALQKNTLEPGEELHCLWGSGYERARAFIEIEHRGKTLDAFWSDANATQASVRKKVTDEMRGGFTVRVTQVSEHSAYFTSQKIEVPWSNKELNLKWDRFTSKLEPGQKEKWTLTITGTGAERAAAEMVATLYDQSLDAFLGHGWPQNFLSEFYSDTTYVTSFFTNQPGEWEGFDAAFRRDWKDDHATYWIFPPRINEHSGRYEHGNVFALPRSRLEAPGASLQAHFATPMDRNEVREVATPLAAREKANVARGTQAASADDPVGSKTTPKINLNHVSTRQNLNETAFFFPHLISDEKGQVRMEFVMPEALTQWRFLSFAHDARLRGGSLTGTTVTAKDFMVQPNAPRFVREGDVLEFTAKVLNQSDRSLAGKVRLSFADARTGDPVNEQLGLTASGVEQTFEIAAKASRSFAWRIRVPDGMAYLTYKVVGATETLSDGEEGYLPVLPRRILVTESLPVWLQGPGEKAFRFEKLGAAADSPTLRHDKLVVQMVSNPAWYGVMALPYLMEFPHECSEQIFNRLYANSLAAHIANSNPKIRRVFDQWRGTESLESPLEKNEDIKGLMLEETPWVRQAADETQARQNVGALFDANRLTAELERAAAKLAEQQLGDGRWPWFAGGRGDNFITLYITAGFGRLRHLGVDDVDVSPAVRALAPLDRMMDDAYKEILRHSKPKDENHLNPTIALYFYARSFFLEEQSVARSEALNFWLGQARKYWITLDRQSQAHLAIGLKRFGETETPIQIATSLKERAVLDDELGMFWRDTERSWWWYRAPIETQAMMIEVFDEVANDERSVDQCRTWLLKQKQTQDWKTTKATADAIYALLLRGTDILASDELIQVSLGGERIEPDKVEAGTGFYERRFAASQITAPMSEITVKKGNKGVGWGGVHWQYLEEIGKVTPYEGTPLTLKKSLWVKENTAQGPTLKPAGELKVGDELVVRMELRSDRDMEYLHLKDQRGSGLEPVNVLSAYKFQDGLAYYESTRDTASHFFIDYLPKGTYVFEYSTRVVHRGEYQSGVASIQCMYAPEFNSHSQSFELTVR